MESLKLPPIKLEPLNCSMKLLSLDVVFYFCKSIIRPCYLDMLQKRVCSTVGPLLAASVQSLADRQNVISSILFYSYYFGRCSSDLAELVLHPHSRGRSTRDSNRLRDFSHHF